MRTVCTLAAVIVARMCLLADPTFIGAAACAPCHPKQSMLQGQSGHAHSLHRPEDHPQAASFANSQEFHRGVFFLQSELGTGDLAFSIRDRESTMRIPVDWAFGAGAQAITFVSRIRNDLYLEHALSYYTRSRTMDITPGHQSVRPESIYQAAGLPYPADLSERSIRNCFACHSTGGVAFDSDMRARPVETGVRCEACHGPGAAHREKAAAGEIAAARKAIRNPGKRNPAAQIEICGTCHRFPGSSQAEVNWQDAWNVRHQPPYLLQSKCFRSGRGLSCASCHDPHAPILRDNANHYNNVCAGCHAPSATAKCRPPVRANCIGCHMPKVPVSERLLFVNHWIGLYRDGFPLRPSR